MSNETTQDMLARLRRPALLVRAARIGAARYDRAVHLPRWLRGTDLPAASEKRAAHGVLSALLQIEARMNDARRTGAAGYLVADHVDLLIAILGEARLSAVTGAPAGAPDATPPQAKASGIDTLRSATNASSASAMPGSMAGC